MGSSRRPIQVDPYYCGCTECLTGEYVPLRDATWLDIHRMMIGLIGNATEDEFAGDFNFTYISRFSKQTWKVPSSEDKPSWVPEGFSPL